MERKNLSIDEVGELVTKYYEKDESELRPADPDEMTINVRDIIQAARNNQNCK